MWCRGGGGDGGEGGWADKECGAREREWEEKMNYLRERKRRVDKNAMSGRYN